MDSTENIIGWNILPEEIKSIKLKQLLDLSKAFDRLIGDIVISEYERAQLLRNKSQQWKPNVSPASAHTPASAAVPAGQKSSSGQKSIWDLIPTSKTQEEPFTWGNDDPEQSSNNQVEEELDWGNDKPIVINDSWASEAIKW